MCEECNKQVLEANKDRHLMSTKHNIFKIFVEKLGYTIQTFKNVKYQLSKQINSVDIPQDELLKILKKYYKGKFKFQLYAYIKYVRIVNEQEQEFNPKFYAKATTVTSMPTEEDLDAQIFQIKNFITEHEHSESNWVFSLITRIRLDLFKYQSLVGGTYIKLPFTSTDRKSVV